MALEGLTQVTYVGVSTLNNLAGGNINFSGIGTFGLLNVGTGGTVITTTATGRVGIATVTQSFPLDINGDARITSTNKVRFGGNSTSTNFYIQYNSTTNSLDFVAG